MAQLVEQLTLNQWVPGSSPGGCTKSLDSVVCQGFAALGAIVLDSQELVL